MLRVFLGQETFDEHFIPLIYYILDQSESVSMEKLTKTAQDVLSKEKGDQVMTLAEKLRMEGKLEGKREGRLEGKLEGKLEGALQEAREAVVDVISVRFGSASIFIIEALENLNDISVLKKLRRDALKADTEQDFAEILQSEIPEEYLG